MEWINGFKQEIEHIFAEASAEIGHFPAPLDEKGQAMLALFNPLQRGGRTNYICFLLPLWLREQTALPPEVYTDLAIGNIHAMLHFFLLDDAMDEAPGRRENGLRGTLVLGQLFQTRFHKHYHRHFPADSTVWGYYNRYIADWAAAVYYEGKAAADPQDSQQIARKSAPVKLCAAGILLLTGEEERLAHLEEAIDLTLATLQLADDWADWRDDLAEENCSTFLTLVRQQLLLSSEVPLNERTVKAAIYRHGCLDRLASIAEMNGGKIREIPDVPAMLTAFHNTVADGIRKDASLAKETTEKLARGGLSHFFQKVPKNDDF